MLKTILKSRVAKFEKAFDYNADYMREIIDASPAAGIRLQGLPFMGSFRGPDLDLWAGASLASTLEGDCGPCVQLIVDMATRSGVDPQSLKAAVAAHGKTDDTVGLGYRFALAAIHDTEDADALRDEIRGRFGEEAVIAASFASALGRVYPVLKRGLGHGKTCQALRFGKDEPFVLKAAE